MAVQAGDNKEEREGKTMYTGLSRCDSASGEKGGSRELAGRLGLLALLTMPLGAPCPISPASFHILGEASGSSEPGRVGGR